jgi:hypothetical protein
MNLDPGHPKSELWMEASSVFQTNYSSFARYQRGQTKVRAGRRNLPSNRFLPVGPGKCATLVEDFSGRDVARRVEGTVRTSGDWRSILVVLLGHRGNALAHRKPSA